MTAIDPTAPQTIDELEDELSTPDEQVCKALSAVDGDILVLGAGGKMGPTLARMARRASDAAGVDRRIIAVSRFSSSAVRQRLESHGVETVSCDLLDEAAVSQLPDSRNVVFMAGMKFGATDNPSLTWAMNCYLPAVVAKRYTNSRIAVFSSGNVYGMVSPDGGGSRESDEPDPIGEYAMTVLGRERVFEYFSRTRDTPMSILRLNYATELRYGVLVDLARDVAGERAIDVSMGHVNVIWQTEANAMALRSLTHVSSPPVVFNIAGVEILRIRDVVARFAELLHKPTNCVGRESGNAFLSNGTKSYGLLGTPSIGADQMIRWTAEWVNQGRDNLNKPTHFGSRDGKY